MSTPSKTVKEKIEIMKNLLFSFYKIDKKYRVYDNDNKTHLIEIGQDRYNIMNNISGKRVLSLKHRVWDFACIDEEHIIVNGDYRFALVLGDEKIFINSRLTEKKYNEIIKSESVFNHLLLNQSGVPSYEDIELAIGIRNIMQIDKNVRHIGLILNYKHIDWDMIANIKELYA